MKKPNFKIDLPKPKLPKLELGLPSYLSRKPSSDSAPKAASKTNVKAPKFVADLYADLRDRRLLPLVALLLVAIVAVPFLLAGGGDEEETPPPSAGVPAGTAASPASFAVVPADPSLRDYRKRLRHRQALDPFRQPTTGSNEESGQGSGGESSGSGGASLSPAELESGGSSAPEAVSEPTETQTTTDVVVQNNVVSYTIDARTGFVGEGKPEKEIAPLTKLPSAKNPIVVFMGLSEDKKRALLLMTSKVTAFYGKGHCAFDKQSCTLLELKLGRSAIFATGFGEAEQRYKVTLEKIVPVVKTQEQASATVTAEQAK